MVVWDDPNNDGDPSDASYVISAQNIISPANTNTLELTTLPICVPVSQSFFVGFLINAGDNHLGGFQEPAAVDGDRFLPNRSYITAAPGGAGDIYNLSNNYLLPLGTYEYNSGKAGNFIIRANPWQVPEPADHDPHHIRRVRRDHRLSTPPGTRKRPAKNDPDGTGPRSQMNTTSSHDPQPEARPLSHRPRRSYYFLTDEIMVPVLEPRRRSSPQAAFERQLEILRLAALRQSRTGRARGMAR